MDIPETVFIFGAGHVGRELSTICNFAGFCTIVIDDRREFANAERFPTADEIIVPDSFQDCFRSLSVNASAYVVVVTRGHAFDQYLLSCALRTSAFQNGEMDICRPCYMGKHGHPPLISIALSGAISGFKKAGGMRTLLSRLQIKKGRVI